MANNITNIYFSNTFGDLVRTANNLVNALNYLGFKDWDKPTGQFSISSSGDGFVANTSAVFRKDTRVEGIGSSLYVQNNAEIGKKLSLSDRANNETLYSNGVSVFANGTNYTEYLNKGYGVISVGNTLFANNVDVLKTANVNHTNTNSLFISFNTSGNTAQFSSNVTAANVVSNNFIYAADNITTAKNLYVGQSQYVGIDSVVVGTSYTNVLQANSRVNTATLSVTGSSYTNTLQANTNVLTGIVQANSRVNTATLSVTGTSYTNTLQANTSVNTATLSVTGTSYTNTLQANTNVLTGIVQANSRVNTAILSVTGTSYTNTLQANTNVLTGIVQANSRVNTATLSVTGTSYTNTLQANTNVLTGIVQANSRVNTATLSVTGTSYTNTLQANTNVLTGIVQANTSVNTATLSVTGTGFVNTLQANTNVNTATLSVTGTGFVNTLQANTNVNTATLSVTGSSYTNVLQANTNVNTSTLSVTGTSYTNTLQANTNVLTGIVQANTSVNTATLSVTGTGFVNTLQANTNVNTATLSVTGTSYTNTLQANTNVLTGIVQANSRVNTATLSVTGTSYTNTLQANTNVLTGIVQANTSVNTATLSVTGTSYTNTLQANTSVNTAVLSVTGTGFVNTLQANTNILTGIVQANSRVNTATLSVTGTGFVNILQANTNVLTGIVQANTSVNTATLSVTGTGFVNTLQANTNVNTAILDAKTIGTLYGDQSSSVNNIYANTATIKTISVNNLTVTGTQTIAGTPTFDAISFKLSANTPIWFPDRITKPAELIVNRTYNSNPLTWYSANADASLSWSELSKRWRVANVVSSTSNTNIVYTNIVIADDINDNFTNTSNTRVASANTLTSTYNIAISANTTANLANTVAFAANTTANLANTTANLANTVAFAANTTANLANTTANLANTVAFAANTTANLANTRSNQANTTANLANTTANLANTVAFAANTTANLANTTANLANTVAFAANTTANLANTRSNQANTTANLANTVAFAANTTANLANTVAFAANTKANDAYNLANSAITVTGYGVTITGSPVKLGGTLEIQLTSPGGVASITGTTNQVTATDSGGGNYVLSTPQNIHTGAIPSFAGINLNGIAYSNTRLVASGSISSPSGIATATAGLGSIEIKSPDNLAPAMMAFNIPNTPTGSTGQLYFGLDRSDYRFKIGGWSAGATANTIALSSDKLNFFASTTSSELAGIISDETGSGSLVFANSPTLSGTPLTANAATGTANGMIASTAFSANATNLVMGTISGDRGVSAGSSVSSFVEYNGTTKTQGQFYGGTDAPTNTTRLNYDGNFYATTFYGAGTGLTGTASSLTAGLVTNGVYTTGSYANPSWITSLDKSKVGLTNVENTALSTWAGSVNLTTIGNATAQSLVVSGDLIVNGTTTNVNSTVVTIDDPILTLGGDTSTVDVVKDRGIEAKWNGTTLSMTNFVGDGTTTVKGTVASTSGYSVGDIITISGATTTEQSKLNGTWKISNIVSGTQFSFVINSTLTTGNYTTNIGTTVKSKNAFFGIDQSTGKFTFIPQANNTSEVFTGNAGIISANSFESLVSTGTAPLSVASTTVVTNLNADLLDGQDGSYYTNASNLSSGTVPTTRLSNIPNSSLVNSSVTINGTSVSLGSSATVTANAQTLTSTTLNPNIVNSSLTSVGTITSGTWSGSFGAVSGANLTTLNASNLSSGTISGDRGVTAGSATSSFIEYNGTTKTSGQFYGGTDAPTNTTRLNYDGELYVTKLGGAFNNVLRANSASVAAQYIVFKNNSATEKFAYDNSEELYIDVKANTSNVANTLVARTNGGHIYANTGYFTEVISTGDVSAYNSSDIRLKENVENIKNPIEKLKQIGGYTFDWNDEYIQSKGGVDNYFVKKHDVGVIAQEIETVLPELVVTKSDGYKAVKYEKIIALLIEAVKEQQNTIDELKSLIEK